MPIVDFHNHYYPPAYLKALETGPSAVHIDYDSTGNPRLHYPGDYNIAVPGQRDLDVRARMLDDNGIDTQVLTLTTPGTHVESPETGRRATINLTSLVGNLPGAGEVFQQWSAYYVDRFAQRDVPRANEDAQAAQN